MNKNPGDKEKLEDDDYFTALIGDPGLALRVSQLEQLKNDKKRSNVQSKKRTSTSMPQFEVVPRIPRVGIDWSEKIINFFKCVNILKHQFFNSNTIKVTERYR